MKVAHSPYFADGQVSFNVKHGSTTYSVLVKFFPFNGGMTEAEILNTEIKDFLTPIARLEYKIPDADENIDDALWLMSGQALYLMEELKNCNINMIAERIAMEIGFLRRVEDYQRRLRMGKQISLF